MIIAIIREPWVIIDETWVIIQRAMREPWGLIEGAIRELWGSHLYVPANQGSTRHPIALLHRILIGLPDWPALIRKPLLPVMTAYKESRNEWQFEKWVTKRTNPFIGFIWGLYWGKSSSLCRRWSSIIFENKKKKRMTSYRTSYRTIV